jgi:hypothetical protein
VLVLAALLVLQLFFRAWGGREGKGERKEGKKEREGKEEEKGGREGGRAEKKGCCLPVFLF